MDQQNQCTALAILEIKIETTFHLILLLTDFKFKSLYIPIYGYTDIQCFINRYEVI